MDTGNSAQKCNWETQHHVFNAVFLQLKYAYSYIYIYICNVLLGDMKIPGSSGTE